MGPEGVELARLRIEQWANDHRSPTFMVSEGRINLELN